MKTPIFASAVDPRALFCDHVIVTPIFFCPGEMRHVVMKKFPFWPFIIFIILFPYPPWAGGQTPTPTLELEFGSRSLGDHEH